MAVTGASGFIGRAVTRRIGRGALGDIAKLRLSDVQPTDHGDGPLDQPALDATAALTAGFVVDGDTDVLVEIVLPSLAPANAATAARGMTA